mmetsp:Transcript_29123/g.64116  ORF Transcript_29123/g.64116 Transcript_29123/m.64116 type:complete len:207 (-) Transcript_29123:120-740(-)
MDRRAIPEQRKKGKMSRLYPAAISRSQKTRDGSARTWRLQPLEAGSSARENSLSRFISGGFPASRSQDECVTSILWDILSSVLLSISANSKAILSILAVRVLISSSCWLILSSFSILVRSAVRCTSSISALEAATSSCKAVIRSLKDSCISMYCLPISWVTSRRVSISAAKLLSKCSHCFLPSAVSFLQEAICSSRMNICCFSTLI